MEFEPGAMSNSSGKHGVYGRKKSLWQRTAIYLVTGVQKRKEGSGDTVQLSKHHKETGCDGAILQFQHLQA